MTCQPSPCSATRVKNGSDDAYAYDDNGNITSIARGTVSVAYEYNGANELIRENNQFTNQTVTYSIWASTEG